MDQLDAVYGSAKGRFVMVRSPDQSTAREIVLELCRGREAPRVDEVAEPGRHLAWISNDQSPSGFENEPRDRKSLRRFS